MENKTYNTVFTPKCLTYKHLLQRKLKYEFAQNYNTERFRFIAMLDYYLTKKVIAFSNSR